eukprot:SAG31_NODE_18024_length_649_cov_1.085455_1_plen_120_part_00
MRATRRLKLRARWINFWRERHDRLEGEKQEQAKRMWLRAQQRAGKWSGEQRFESPAAGAPADLKQDQVAAPDLKQSSHAWSLGLLVASCFLGVVPPTLRRSVFLVRAIRLAGGPRRLIA